MSLRTAILGCGGFAHTHARNLTRLKDDFTLVAFCDVDETRAHLFSQQYTDGKGATFTEPQKMFDQGKLDLAVICLPPYGHADEVEVAAQHGVHLLMEKPIALTSDHAWQMVDAVETAGIKTQVGFMYRFGEAVERMKVLLDSGAAGPAGLMSARYFCNALHAPWWRSKEKSGGQLVEQVIHMVDLMRYLMGNAVTVYSRQDNLFHREMPDYTVEDISATVFGFANGGLGVIYATNGAIPNRWINDYRLVAQKLTAEFADANHATFVYTDLADQAAETITSERDYYLEELLDLLNAIRSGCETRTPMREGAKSLDLALAARQSAEERKEVSLK
jgi:predicted dehydrogenase